MPRGSILLVSLLLFGGLATGDDSPTLESFAWSEPESREYLDAVTSLVHDYTSDDDTLTPTLETGSLPGFVCTDAFHSTSTCGAVSATPSPCPHDPNCTANCTGYQACAAASAAFVGQRLIEAQFIVLRPCAEPQVSSQSNANQLAAGDAVSFLRAWTRLSNTCGPGTLVVELLVDGAVVSRAETPYT